MVRTVTMTCLLYCKGDDISVNLPAGNEPHFLVCSDHITSAGYARDDDR
jgi:hypothetical protein